MILLVGIIAFAWPKGTFGGDNFTGQQLVVFGTSLSDNGNGIDPYIRQTLGLAATKQVGFSSLSSTINPESDKPPTSHGEAILFHSGGQNTLQKLVINCGNMVQEMCGPITEIIMIFQTIK